MPTIDDARHFVEANSSFFEAPLNSQAEFSAFYESRGQTDAIEDYSKKFFTVLKETLFEAGKYEAPVWILWKQGHFKEALEHQNVRQFIIDNAEHPALNLLKSMLQQQNPEASRTEISNKIESIQAELIKTVTDNLLKLKEPFDAPRSLGERLLDKVSQIFGFGGYQSRETKIAEESMIKLSVLGQSLPDAMNNTFITAKIELTALREKNKQEPEPDSPDANLSKDLKS